MDFISFLNVSVQNLTKSGVNSSHFQSFSIIPDKLVKFMLPRGSIACVDPTNFIIFNAKFIICCT